MRRYWYARIGYGSTPRAGADGKQRRLPQWPGHDVLNPGYTMRLTGSLIASSIFP
jgi:hypothetical protein